MHTQVNIFANKQRKKIIFAVEKQRKIQGFPVDPNDYLEFNSDGALLLLRRQKPTAIYNVT
ncbi:hypothetical protein [Candidatus Uabimicrobium sp. HlEnr_7]|uniref:hypothetical protein n=1 Tax=Candidatus Uabimicrobium helgolandensis TaxID=3095367 RepID=UPI00355775CD